MGHIHGDYQADIAFPVDVRDRLVAEGKAEPHHVLPQSGWITFRLTKEEDAEAAVELFGLSYSIAKERPEPAELPRPEAVNRMGGNHHQS